MATLGWMGATLALTGSTFSSNAAGQGGALQCSNGTELSLQVCLGHIGLGLGFTSDTRSYLRLASGSCLARDILDTASGVKALQGIWHLIISKCVLFLQACLFLWHAAHYAVL